jgi:hypothetical protein
MACPCKALRLQALKPKPDWKEFLEPSSGHMCAGDGMLGESHGRVS